MCRKEGNIMDERFEIVRRFVGSKGLGKKTSVSKCASSENSFIKSK